LTEAKNFYIVFYHSQEDTISFPYYEDEDDDEQSEDSPIYNPTKRISLNDFKGSPTVKIFKTGKTQHLNKKTLKNMGATGRISEDWLGTPLKHENNILGAIVVQSYKSGFVYSHKDEYLLNYVSQHIAIALQRKKDTESLKQAHKELQQVNSKLENHANEVSTANIKLEAMLEERRSIQKNLFMMPFTIRLPAYRIERFLPIV